MEQFLPEYRHLEPSCGIWGCLIRKIKLAGEFLHQHFLEFFVLIGVPTGTTVDNVYFHNHLSSFSPVSLQTITEKYFRS